MKSGYQTAIDWYLFWE